MITSSIWVMVLLAVLCVPTAWALPGDSITVDEYGKLKACYGRMQEAMRIMDEFVVDMPKVLYDGCNTCTEMGGGGYGCTLMGCSHTEISRLEHELAEAKAREETKIRKATALKEWNRVKADCLWRK